MEEKAIRLEGKKKSIFIDKVKELLPDGGNLSLCLTCGACASGCPATGLEGLDPRKFLRMAALGLDEEIKRTPWVWMCSMCQRCIYVCPMEINIPQLVYYARQTWPREERPKGILGSCDMALRNESCSAMGASPDDFTFVVEDVVEEYREAQPEFADMQAPIDKQGAEFFLNQNSREPVTEPDETGPAVENPAPRRCAPTGPTVPRAGPGKTTACSWPTTTPGEHITRTSAKQAEDLGVPGVSQHRMRARHLLGPGRTEKIRHRA
jgi:ferredoxin